MKSKFLFAFGISLGLSILVGCQQAPTPAIPGKSETPLVSPAKLASWPSKTLTIGLTLHQPLTLAQTRSMLSPFGKAFHAGFFVIGEGVGTFRTQSAVPVDKVLAEVLRVAKHLAYVKPVTTVR